MTVRLLIATLFLGAFVTNMNTLSLGPFLSPIAEDIDSTVPLVGQTATAALIVGAIFGLLLGPISDHYGLRRLLVFGALLMAASGIGTALAFNYWSLILMRLPAGIAAGMLLGLAVSVANTRVPDDDRRSAFAWITGAGALAAVAGVPFLAFLADVTSWRAGFWFIGVLGLGLALAYVRVISPDPPVPDESFRPFRIFHTYREILANVRMVWLQGGNLLWALVWIGTITYLGAYLTDTRGVSLGTVGYVFMWGGLWFFVGNRCAPWLTRSWSPQGVIVPTGVLLSLSVASFFAVSTGQIGLVLLTGLLGLTGGLGLPLITILISETTSTAHGTVMMLRQFTWGMGAGLGAAGGGILLGIGGYPALGAGLAGFSTLAALLVSLSIRTDPSPVQTPASGASE